MLGHKPAGDGQASMVAADGIDPAHAMESRNGKQPQRFWFGEEYSASLRGREADWLGL
jgi:hypothetical protein